MSARPLSSSGTAMRPSGTIALHIRSVSSSGSSVPPPPMRVPLNGPGQIALMSTLCGASSSAAWRTTLRIAALLAT